MTYVRGISKHYVGCHLYQPWLHNDVIVWISLTKKRKQTKKKKHEFPLQHMILVKKLFLTKLNVIIIKSSTLKVIITFCGTCPAGTHWDQSLSPASGSVYSAHTHSAWMCRKPARRWEPWNCCHNSHNRVQQSITNLCKKSEKLSLLCILNLYLSYKCMDLMHIL